MNNNSKSIEMIKLIASALGDLNEKAIFIGGATVPFYLPKIYWAKARPTEDVDIVMNIVGRISNWIQDDDLRKKGFTNDITQGAPICRWVYNGLKVDFMNFDESILGFTNTWYQEGVENCITVIKKPIDIKILQLPYFLATKIEAFKSRGNQDFQGSKDMEDIISVLEVSEPELLEKELTKISQKLKEFLKKELSYLLQNREFIDCIPGALFNRVDIKSDTENLIARLKLIVQLLE